MVADWSQDRDFPFTGLPELQNAWDFSRNRIGKLSQALLTGAPQEVACIAISGSLGRMEAHQDSDLDLLIVVDDRQLDIHPNTAPIFDTVWKQLTDSALGGDLKQPKPGGVFSKCVSWKSLTDPAVRGIVNEDVTSYGQRMQLLLDAQPVTNPQKFAELREDVLNWYSETRVSAVFREVGVFHWLWQEVHRYWRSIRARACWLHQHEPAKSLEVNVKLRSSRLVLIAAFLWAIHEAHASGKYQGECIRALASQLKLTPLERIAGAAGTEHQRAALLGSYQDAWSFLSMLPPSEIEVPAVIHAALDNIRQNVERLPGHDYRDWLF